MLAEDVIVRVKRAKELKVQIGGGSFKAIIYGRCRQGASVTSGSSLAVPAGRGSWRPVDRAPGWCRTPYDVHNSTPHESCGPECCKHHCGEALVQVGITVDRVSHELGRATE